MNSKILHTIANAIDNKEEVKKRNENGKLVLQDLLNCVQSCQNRFGGKSELATEDDIRIAQLCEKWEKALSHGIRTNLSSSSIQSLVTAGINFTFNIINIGNSLWSYTCLHLTKHEKERFKILSNINTPVGYFRAFIRAALNERSLERYLQSWVAHGLLLEYYDEGALVRDVEASNLLPNMASGLSSILFALSIDRPELNEQQQTNQVYKAEHVIPLPTPVKSSGNLKRRPLRQVISFDKSDNNPLVKKHSTEAKDKSDDSMWNSAPATCLNSPDPKVTSQIASTSEPTSSEYKGFRHFFPDSVKSIDSPSQILTKLSERAKEIFSSSNSIDVNVIKDDISELSINNLKIYESDSEDIAVSIDGSNSCLELCFTEDESVPDEKSLSSLLEIKEKEYINLQLKCSQIEIACKEKIHKLENVVLDLSKENDRLKEQLRHYMSAVEMGKAFRNNNTDTESNEEVSQYERKLVQVAEMHAELMEFNQHLQKKLQDMESASAVEVLEYPESNVKAYIPCALLVGKKTRSYHVYQIFLKIGAEEWNVYHRYAKFHELHTQLRKCHPDISTYKFPPKKTLRKRDAHLVEQRRLALQAYLRHILLVLPELRECTSRAQLITLLPFFGTSSTVAENGVSHSLSRQQSMDSISTYNAL